jgi:Tfp pilus assembly major pilin PilA
MHTCKLDAMLVELMTVVVIISNLSAIAHPGYRQYAAKADHKQALRKNGSAPVATRPRLT